MNIEKTLKLVGMALDTLGDKVVQREKEIYELKERIKVLAEALKLAQFGFNHRRCPVCAGWNMSENGETDMIHRKDCKISIALAAVKEE